MLYRKAVLIRLKFVLERERDSPSNSWLTLHDACETLDLLDHKFVYLNFGFDFKVYSKMSCLIDEIFYLKDIGMFQLAFIKQNDMQHRPYFDYDIWKSIMSSSLFSFFPYLQLFLHR